jgi:tetratricopeptide (TPR) repeat protein
VLCGLPAGAKPRAQPDVQAINDCLEKEGEPRDRYVSARALSHYMQAVMARNGGDGSTALAELRLAALYDAEDPYAQVALAREYLRLGNPKDAMSAVQNALLIDGNDSPALCVLGRIQLELGEASRAVTTLRRAVTLTPAATEPWALLVDALLANADPAGAAARAEKLASRDLHEAAVGERRMVAGALGHAAEALARQGDNDRAERLLQRAIELDPMHVERHLALSRFYEVRNRLVDAAEICARATCFSEDKSKLALEAARLYLQAGRRPEASAYIVLLAGDPDGEKPLVRLGDMLVDAGDRDDALRAYRTATRLSPGAGDALVKTAELLEGEGRYAEAAVAYRQVSVTDEVKDYAETRAFLCDVRVLEASGQHAQAVEIARSLAHRNPPEGDVLDFLARALAARGDNMDEAEAVARSAVARWPENGAYLDTLGVVLMARGSPEAFGVLERAAAALPARADAQLDLAEAALAAGHPDAAAAALSRADTLDVSSATAANGTRVARLRAKLAAAEKAGVQAGAVRAGP